MNRSLFDLIRTGPDWLDHPDLLEFLRRHGLQDVRVQLVGPRRSFAGKTWPAWALVRMVSVGVHPVRWLLTFMHELAHVADFRQRVSDLEQQWGRPLRPGSHDGRQVWHLQRPHGERWRQEFIRLAREANAAGLFPGNEAAVLAAAEAGATTLDDVELDLTADPRVDAEELRLLDEQQRLRLTQAVRQTEEFRQQFRTGEAVHFDGGPRRGVIAGTLERINRKTCTVRAGTTRWHVPHSFLRPGDPPADARPAVRPLTPRERFSPGDEVSFAAAGRRHRGRIMRVNRKTCTVQTPEGNWRVSFSLLRPVKQ